MGVLVRIRRNTIQLLPCSLFSFTRELDPIFLCEEKQNKRQARESLHAVPHARVMEPD